MRKATRISLALGTSAALLTLSALPASAVNVLPDADGVPVAATVDSVATVVVPSGPLSIDVAENKAKVDFQFSETFGDEDKSLVVDVPQVTIKDLRAGTAGWTISVAMSDFINTSAEGTIDVSKATYAAGTVTYVGAGAGAAAIDNALTLGETLAAAAVQAEVVGNNTASWEPKVTVPVRSDALAGTYTATLTHSLL